MATSYPITQHFCNTLLWSERTAVQHDTIDVKQEAILTDTPEKNRMQKDVIKE